MRLLRNAEQFQGKDREHARHRVEHDTAEKRQQQRLPPDDAAFDWRGRSGVGADLIDALGAVLAAQRQHAIERCGCGAHV
jgi:hypothetical protein